MRHSLANPRRILGFASAVFLSVGSVGGLASRCAAAPAFAPVKTKVFHGGDEAEKVSVDVTGIGKLHLHVTYGGDDYRSDQAIWAEPTLFRADGTRVDLTSLKPAHAQVGWGTLFVNQNQRGLPLRIGKQQFAKGFWAHGPSLLTFVLDGEFVRFEAWVGIDTGAGRNGSAEFEVTNVAPAMPSRAEYAKEVAAPPVKVVPPAAESPHHFHAEGAIPLLASGINKLVFVRRLTLTANHVYTEYVNSRWTPGGGLAVLDLETGEAHDLVPELRGGVVNRFDLSFDARKIVFDYKRSANEGYRLYEVNVDGTGLRQLTFPAENEAELVRRYGSRGYHHGTDDMHPCYLPDGGIVFASTRCQYSVLCNASDVYTTKNLFRMEANGSHLRPLTNSPLSEASPAVLPDGRIVYHRWEYVDKAAGNLKCLWAMNPDGSATTEVYGNTITFPETMIYPRPIPNSGGKIVMLGTSHCCPNNAMGAVVVVDPGNDLRAESTMRFVTDDIRALAHTGFHFRDDSGNWTRDETGAKGRLFKDPYPVSEDLFIAAHKPAGKTWNDSTAYELCVLDGQGHATPLYRDEAVSCWHPYPLTPRPVPPVVPSRPDPELAAQRLALCMVTDVYAGMEGVKRGAVKYLRVLEEVPRPWAARNASFQDDRDGMAHCALGQGHLGLKVQYGVVPVETDGSAQFYVPAARNLYFQALDENLLAIQTERTYVHYQPGEKRSCVGCHETPDRLNAVARATPLALARPPSHLGAQPGEVSGQKLFDYDRDLQPIWNRHCLPCHDAKQAAGGVDLSGAPQGVYSVSYYSLLKLGRGGKDLLGTRGPRNENVGSADIQYLPPYRLGALSSPLTGFLSGGAIVLPDPARQAYAEKLLATHPKVRLDRRELLQVTNWLDVNCPYYPSYWGRRHAKFAGRPDFRPAVTFEDALSRTVPASIARLESQATASTLTASLSKSTSQR